MHRRHNHSHAFTMNFNGFRYQIPSVLAGVVSLSLSPAIVAQTATVSVMEIQALARDAARAALKEETEAITKDVKIQAAGNSFESKLKELGFGGGVAAIFTRGDREVGNAAVDSGGILRADFKSRDRIGGILEAHHLFGARYATSVEKKAQITMAINENKVTPLTDFAAGIMVGAELGENALRSLGVGGVLSWRRFEVDGTGKLTAKVAFNLGAMVLIEPNVKMLADGLRDGSALPTGLTEVRFKEESRTGFALFFSAGF
jgi:hypothetical protein